jgi:hypothetical protein
MTLVALLVLGAAACGGESASARDPSTQRRTDVPTKPESAPANERGAQPNGQNSHSKAPWMPKSGR